jgi:hypothetical protein
MQVDEILNEIRFLNGGESPPTTEVMVNQRGAS